VIRCFPALSNALERMQVAQCVSPTWQLPAAAFQPHPLICSATSKISIKQNLFLSCFSHSISTLQSQSRDTSFVNLSDAVLFAFAFAFSVWFSSHKTGRSYDPDNDDTCSNNKHQLPSCDSSRKQRIWLIKNEVTKPRGEFCSTANQTSAPSLLGLNGAPTSYAKLQLSCSERKRNTTPPDPPWP
jgi:hypothetical protein